jgi:hypothetical protein
MPPTREVHADGWCVRLDLGRQVLRLEVPEADSDWHPGARKASGPPLSPVLPLVADGPVSAATLLLKAKQFDDGLHAAAELAAQQGLGRFPGKASLLRSLATTLADEVAGSGKDAAVAIHAACQLGGLPVPAPEPLQEAVRTATADFLRDELASQPLGFYAWAPELSALFRQDRFLQQPLDPGPADALAYALGQTPGAADAYAACLRLNARLTGPAKPLSVWDAGKRPPFLPPSRSHEVTLFERLYEGRPVPDGFDLMAELIRRVRSGEIGLMPGERSGWYDHQTWSLEPLLLPDRRPEAARLDLGKRYRKHLEDLFRGALALARETHARQAGGGRGGYGGPRQHPVVIHPGLTVEPLPTVFSRRAAGYRFARSVLEESFGADALERMHRLTPDGAAAAGLAEELAGIEGLFAGASATATQELGMGLPDGGDAAARRFSGWRAKARSDADVSRDVRMMVPVFYDVQRRRTKVWALLGWRTTTVDVAYRVPPTVLGVEALSGAGQPVGEPPPVVFSGDRYEFPVPVTAEVYVTRLLDRDEFRGHCDRHQSRDAILANLS